MLEKRIKNLRLKMQELCIDAVLITSMHNIRYISGFTGSEAYVVITQSSKYIIVDPRYIIQVSEQAKNFKALVHKGGPLSILSQLLSKTDIKSIGFEDKNILYSSYVQYYEVFKSKLKPVGDLFDKFRMYKDKNELKNIRKAIEIADEAFLNTLNNIKPGASEKDVAAELEYHMKKGGSQNPAFETIVASGYRSALPHGIASDKLIDNGDSIVLDFGAVYDGYCSDISRTVFVGKPNNKLLEVYNIVLNALEEAENKAESNMEGKEIDSIAREYITKNGYGDYFSHGLGHGVGLLIHEDPTISLYRKCYIQDGMTVTMEPGIYIQGLGGVRIEDVVVFENGKPVILTKSTKEIINL